MSLRAGLVPVASQQRQQPLSMTPNALRSTQNDRHMNNLHQGVIQGAAYLKQGNEMRRNSGAGLLEPRGSIMDESNHRKRPLHSEEDPVTSRQKLQDEGTRRNDSGSTYSPNYDKGAHGDFGRTSSDSGSPPAKRDIFRGVDALAGRGTRVPGGSLPDGRSGHRPWQHPRHHDDVRPTIFRSSSDRGVVRSCLPSPPRKSKSWSSAELLQSSKTHVPFKKRWVPPPGVSDSSTGESTSTSPRDVLKKRWVPPPGVQGKTELLLDSSKQSEFSSSPPLVIDIHRGGQDDNTSSSSGAQKPAIPAGTMAERTVSIDNESTRVAEVSIKSTCSLAGHSPHPAVPAASPRSIESLDEVVLQGRNAENEGRDGNKEASTPEVVKKASDGTDEKSSVKNTLENQDETQGKAAEDSVPSVQNSSPAEKTVLDKIAAEFEAATNDSSDDSSDEEEDDDEQVMAWGRMMFGIAPPSAEKETSADASAEADEPRENPEPEEIQAADEPLESPDAEELQADEPSENLETKEAKDTFRWEDYMPPVVTLAERVKMRRGKDPEPPQVGKRPGTKEAKTGAKRKKKTVEDPMTPQEAKRRKEQAKPLTASELKKILAEDKDCGMACNSSWVRRSVRHPSRSALTSPGVKSLLEKLRVNDSDMEVLKMKKYINDPNTPSVVIEAALDALEENTNCQALYIQNFNEGMRDEQVLHLLRVLQMPTCKIWCLNIGETYNVSMKTWKIFTKGLKKTKITHMYASEHTITPALKDEIRDTIRQNRSKHNMHRDPENLDIIVQCTHCWWNPINAKVLRPFIRKQGYESLLHDAKALGLKGSEEGNLA